MPFNKPSSPPQHLAGVDLLKNLIQRTGSLQPISQLPLPCTPLSPLALTHGHRHSSVSFQIGSHCLHKRSDTSPTDAWTPIAYRQAVFDEATDRWVSRAEVAETPFVAFASRPAAQQVPGRLIIRRIPELNPTGQDGLFDVWRFHAFFTTSSLNTVAADKTHRGHAIIEQVHADLKNSALAHLPSGKFAAKAAWLVLAVIAFNLTRAAPTLTGPALPTTATATIRRT